jgi:hypothetical protein
MTETAVWSFGMWCAMESGSLAARFHIEGFDYAEAARRRFDPVREASFFNRVLYEHLPKAAIPWLLRRASRTQDMRLRLSRHWAPSGVKTRAADVSWPRFATARLNHRDRACHSPDCDCVWCTHGDRQVSASNTNENQQPRR